jgi:hypothetical protein
MHYYYRLAVMQQLLYPEERETSSPVLAATLVRNARADKETVLLLNDQSWELEWPCTARIFVWSVTHTDE